MLDGQAISSKIVGTERSAILVIGAGGAQYPFLAALAKEYRLLGTDVNPDACGRIWLDRFLCASAADQDRIVRFARENAAAAEIARVMSFTSFMPQRAASQIAQSLAVPGPAPEMVDCALSKWRLSACVERLEGKERQAVFAQTPMEAATFINSHTGVFYLKPDQGGGGDGVALIEAPKAAPETIAAIFAVANGHGVLIEPAAFGREYIISLAVRNGRLTFFSQGLSIKLKDKIAVPVGQILGASPEPPCLPVISFASRWIEAFDFRDGILGFEILLNGEHMTVLDVDLTYHVPVQLAWRAGGVSIADCLIGKADLVEAGQFPRASGLMHALAETGAVDAPEPARLARALSARYPQSFTALEKPSTTMQTPQRCFVRIGYWQLDGTDQEDVKNKFQSIAQDYYGSELL
jgi:hypothetical protein